MSVPPAIAGGFLLDGLKNPPATAGGTDSCPRQPKRLPSLLGRRGADASSVRRFLSVPPAVAGGFLEFNRLKNPPATAGGTDLHTRQPRRLPPLPNKEGSRRLQF